MKVIGMYSTRLNAEKAVARLSQAPGFCQHPRLVDPTIDKDQNGFYIDEYLLDMDHWREGYVTVYPGDE